MEKRPPFPPPVKAPDADARPVASLEFIHQQLTRHHSRFADSIPLIASENLVSPRAAELFDSDLHNRYAEGVPYKRYYEGNADFDPIEEHAEELAKRLFKAPFADVRPVSGTVANIATLFALGKPGDKLMSPELASGAHISTQKFGAVGLRGLDTVTYPSIPETMSVDTELAAEAIRREKPQITYFGQSVFLFPTDLKPLIEAAKEVEASVMYDAAHVLGLIAGGQFQDPLRDGVDVITASTHKTFPGPQHGIILANEDKELPTGRNLHQTLRSRVFPGVHSNHHLHKTAALGVSLAEALEFQEDYAIQIIKNAKALAQGLHDRGMKVFGEERGFTESHTILVDVTNFGGGADVSLRAEEQGLVMNKNMMPGDTSPVKPSGIRIGTPEVTRLGMKESEMDEVAELIYLVAKDGHADEVRSRAAALKSLHPKVKYCWDADRGAYDLPKLTTDYS